MLPARISIPPPPRGEADRNMKDKKWILNTILAIVCFIALLVMIIVKTFAPIIVLPELSITNLALVSLAALVLDHYIARGAKRCYIMIPVFSFLTFFLLPYGACFVNAMEAVRLGVTGMVIFTLLTFLFTSIQDRISSGPARIVSPVISAFCLYLALQCFSGIVI